MEVIIIVVLLLLFIFLLKQKKWKILLTIGVFLTFLVGSYYYFMHVEPLNAKKEMVRNYFNYFEENFDFHDSLDNYSWEDDYTKKPELRFTFEAYGSTHSLTADSISEQVYPKKQGIKHLRNLVYPHYTAYVMKHFIYDTTAGNDFSKVKEYFLEKGYECGFDGGIYQPYESEGYELYIDKSIQPNVRINRRNKAVSLEEEMSFYKDKSMNDFDYQEYMEYFDYGVVLIGYYSSLEEKTEPLNKKELDKVVEEAMQNERIEIVLKEFGEQE
ncbi:hypothetical protein [Enterococcus sp. LJL51]|uniref:hypothetical protein n=1 Tax=Enterococcus sp. LJL51 TaxID=3416656 RepID=UPI003CE6AA36